MKEVNPQRLQAELIELYEDYLARADYEERAKELDGVWAGSFLLPPAVEKAIDAVSFMYIEPRMSKERAQELLSNLKDES